MSLLDRSQAPRPARVREFRFPDIARTTLPNGLVVLSAQQGVLPVVTLMLVVHAGAEHDDRATAGLAQLTARTLEAGTTTRSADRVAWDFELLGAELDVNVLWDCTALAVTVPSNNVEPALKLLAEVAGDPLFAPAEVDRLKSEQLSELEQRRADPRSLSADMAARFIFAPDVPYARPIIGTPQSVARLTTEHVRTMYAQNWNASRAALIMVGDISADVAGDLSARHLSPFAAAQPNVAEFDVVSPVERTQVFIVDREGSVQSELRVGHVGLRRNTPDYFAAAIANGVLGGIFSSRLNMSLREEHGYTYGVRSGFGFRKQPGPFVIQTAVASDVTAPALDALLTETRKFVQDGATEEEVVTTRDYLAGVMPLEMQTTAQMAGQIADIFVYGLADDYLSQHGAAMLSVSRAEANRAAHDHIRPDEFAITIVGEAKAIESEIAALNLGPIEVHSIEQ